MSGFLADVLRLGFSSASASRAVLGPRLGVLGRSSSTASSSSGSASSSTASTIERRAAGKVDLAADVLDRLALGVGQVHEAGVELDLPEPLVGVGRGQLQQALVDRAELLDVQLAVRQADLAHLPARGGDDGERLQHVGDGGVAPGEPVDHRGAAGVEQAAAVGLDLPFRAELDPLAEQVEQGPERALEERAVGVEGREAVGTAVAGQPHDLAERVALAVGQHVDRQQRQVLGVEDEQEPVEQVERFLVERAQELGRDRVGDRTAVGRVVDHPLHEPEDGPLDLLTELGRDLPLVLLADLADAVEHGRLGRQGGLTQEGVEQLPGIEAGVGPSAIAIRSNRSTRGASPRRRPVAARRRSGAGRR